MSLLTNLISYWKLDEASGTRNDSHGTNHLTDNNTVGSATGIISSAADFERDNQEYLSHSDNADLSTGDIDFSFSVWCKAESFASNFGQILSKWTYDDSNNEYLIDYVNDSTKQFRFGVRSGGTFTSVTDTSFTASTGTWYHIIGSHDSVNNILRIRVNGGTAVTSSYSAGVNDGNGDFLIGSLYGFASNQDSYWDGLVDEVGFWKRVLTPSEELQLYNSGAGLAYESFGGGATVAPPLFTNRTWRRWPRRR